jgi:restriction modification system DNA specificity domain protein
MKYIDTLLQGASMEWKPLGEVAELITTGKLNANAMEENGIYPFFTCNENPYKINTYAFDMEAILISGNGSQVGHINFYKGKFNAYQRTYILGNFVNQILSKFVYYYLKSELRNYIITNSKKGSVPYITLPMLEKFQIPLPPISLQQEIVRILDRFTTLEAELEARKKQYEYYRDNLLTFGDEVEWKALGVVGAFVRGSGLQKIDLTTSGIPAIHYGQIYTYYGVSVEQTISFVTPKTANGLKKVDYGDVIITNTSENLEDVGKAVFYSVKEQGVTGGHATIFKPSKEIIGKYLVYYTQTAEFSNQKRKYAKGTKVIDVSANDLAKITVPIPYPNDTKKSLEEQARIVAILDRFDTLVNSISEGLPKEIALRRKQYEYYREQLLSFPKR